MKAKNTMIMVIVIVIAVATIGGVSYYVLNSGSEAHTSKKIVLQGSGATFLQPQLEAWIQEYMKTHKNIDIEYRGIGSGAGQKEFLINKITDFCGSDPPLSHEQWLKYKGQVLQIPVILGAVAVVYNIPDIPDNIHLNLTPEIIAKIYMGEIKYWDDPSIKQINPKIADRLPHKEIIGVHRSDASGTTQIFTTFLHKGAPDTWPEKLVGKLIDWPIDKTGRGIGGKGNPGVAQYVKKTEYSIGYVELAYVYKSNLRMAAIRNREGVFTLPSPETIKAAASGALKTGLIPDSPDKDFSRELEAIIYAPGKNTYPIVSFSHIFVWKTYSDKDKAEAIKDFLKWIATEGEKDQYIVKGYVAVPDEIKQICLKAVEMITTK